MPTDQQIPEDVEEWLREAIDEGIGGDVVLDYDLFATKILAIANLRAENQELHADLLSEERRRDRVLKDMRYLICAARLAIDKGDALALKHAIAACEQRHDA